MALPKQVMINKNKEVKAAWAKMETGFNKTLAELRALPDETRQIARESMEANKNIKLSAESAKQVVTIFEKVMR